jgi:hypothetical protein
MKNIAKYRQAAIAIAFLTVFFTAGNSAGIANADDSDDSKKSHYNQELILQTFEENNYEAWQKIVAKNKDIKNIIDENQFNKFVEARRAARSGDYEKAIIISQKLENELKQKMSLFYL